MLITMVLPTSAAHGHEGEIVIEDDLRVHAGWWNNQTYGVTLGETTVDESHEPVWVIIERMEGDATVNISTTGAVIAGVDVFEQPEEGGEFTPHCPQEIVYDLYPNEDEPFVSYAFGLTDHGPENQRIAPTGTDDESNLTGQDEIELEELEDDGRYLMALYPQVALGGTAADTLGEATISWQVEGPVSAAQTDRLSEAPIEHGEWVNPGNLPENFDCVNEGFEPPGIVPFPDELPLAQPGSPTMGDLLGTSLPGTVQASSSHELLSLEDLVLPQSSHVCDPKDEKRIDGYIQAPNAAGNIATVTEVTNLFALNLADTPLLLDRWTQGLDAWVWELGCETPGDDVQEEICIQETAFDEELLSFGVFEDLQEPSFAMKFYGDSLADPKFPHMHEIGASGCIDSEEIPSGVENIVIYLQEGAPQGMYFDFFEQPPSSAYSTHFCAAYGDEAPTVC